MSDLTDRLRNFGIGSHFADTYRQMHDAADELDRLQAIMDAAKCRRCDCLPCECGRYLYPSNQEFWKKHEAAEKARGTDG